MSLSGKWSPERKTDPGRSGGDLVFSVVSLARHLDIDAETASHGAIEKFIERFSPVRGESADR